MKQRVVPPATSSAPVEDPKRQIALRSLWRVLSHLRKPIEKFVDIDLLLMIIFIGVPLLAYCVVSGGR